MTWFGSFEQMKRQQASSTPLFHLILYRSLRTSNNVESQETDLNKIKAGSIHLNHYLLKKR
jgi:hypothetical protein